MRNLCSQFYIVAIGHIERHTNSPLADSRGNNLEHLAAAGYQPEL
jgi:hypothetical protein